MVIPYIFTLSISMVIILVFVAIRYRKLGAIKTILKYILWVLAVELLLLSILAITRFPVNRAIIPMGLFLEVAVLTILGLVNENKLSKLSVEKKEK